jgi:2-aminoadipate transaminase
VVCFASRIQRLDASPIRDILNVINKPGMISFAGGLPAVHSFPELRLNVDKEHMQYGASEGEQNLRQWIAADLAERGLETDENHVIILSGSQQGIDLTSKLLVQPHTCVAVESPTYLAALQVFRLFGADFLEYDAQRINDLSSQRTPTLLYTIPTFQNPTGAVYNETTRQAIAGRCDRQDIVLFEDDPYRDLVFEPCERTPICSFLKKAPWIYQSSFSKTLCPGLRLGYLACSPSLYPYLLRLKQAADLHSNRISQAAVLSLLTAPTYHSRLEQLCDHYKDKRDKFNQLLTHYLTDIAHWDIPSGGLFFWIKFKTEKMIDTRKWLPLALDANVAFMPGEPFFSDSRSASNAIRLNFSHAHTDDMEKGIATLAKIIRSQLT